MTSIEFTNLTNYTQWFGSFLIALFAFRFSKKRQRQILIIGIYGVNSVLFQCFQTGFNYYGKVNPNPIGNFYVLTETVILLWLYANAFNRLFFNRIILGVIIIYILVFIWFAIPDLKTMHSNIRTIRDMIMIIASLTYFFLLLKDLPEKNLYVLPMFWINSGILFFFSCTFVFSLSTMYLIEVFREQYGYFLGFRNLLRVLFSIIICIGIWESSSTKN